VTTGTYPRERGRGHSRRPTIGKRRLT